MNTPFKIVSPCQMSWSEMKGDSKVRQCDLCKTDVHNVCNLSDDEVNNYDKYKVIGTIHIDRD